VVFACEGVANAEQQPSSQDGRKVQLEVRKLELEIAALEKRSELPGWLTGILGLLIGAAGTGATVWAARRARLGALDQAVHEKRIESYGDLVDTTARLAVYFPPGESIAQADCRAMGEAMRSWYFAGGGLLMSTQARDAYFALARALTRASLAEGLRVPVFPQNAHEISVATVDKYRCDLEPLGLDEVEKWTFGGPGSGSEKSALRFKDFVFLQ
jgi:hypothetical protein